MSTTTKRHLSAWLLLSVFLPMLVFSSLHVHEVAPSAVGACVDCTNHLPHAGHLSLNSDTSHDCVLCQFLSLSFVLAVPVVLAVQACITLHVLSQRPAHVVSALGRSLIPRAPPVF